MGSIGIPLKLLGESQGHVVTLELTSGQVYRGKLLEAEDNMNVQLKDITVTARDGRVSHLDQVYIRGSHVRFFIVPDMLRLERPYVPIESGSRTRCWYGKRKGYGQQSKDTAETGWWKLKLLPRGSGFVGSYRGSYKIKLVENLLQYVRDTNLCYGDIFSGFFVNKGTNKFSGS
ncbi:hypothetical protein ABW19_dt0206486 [Dactylella cylindrospora]|nr:hypothetical protein ABW19_dt0206486 [Dactylella cylindrospora]